MIWLIIQMWFWLLLAAVFGGLVGWALKSRKTVRELSSIGAQRDAAVVEADRLRSDAPTYSADSTASDRINDLEKKLATEKHEVATLKAKVASISTSSSASSPDADNENAVGDLTWRNRYLESRVRFLEGKLSEVETGGSDHDAGEAGDDIDMDSERLKWRNRYLEGQLRYRKEDEEAKKVLAERAAPASGTSKKSTAKTTTKTTTKSAAAKETTEKPAKTAKAAASKTKKTKTATTKAAKVKANDNTYGGLASESDSAKLKAGDALTKAIGEANQSGSGETAAAFKSRMERDKSYVAGEVSGKPATLKKAMNNEPDDLKKILGVGPKIEKMLNENGIWHFQQVASWTKKETAWMDDQLSFRGRIERDRWIAQAKSLASGDAPEKSASATKKK